MAAFSAAFLRAESGALELLRDDFRHPSIRLERVRQASARRIEAVVVQALREQASQRPMTVERQQSLDALAEGAPVVVTGQQVGLFLGPLYTLYKAATAVSTARALTAESGTRCVPVFWLQSEDHDFEEIDHCVVHQRDGQLVPITLRSAHVERASVGAIRLGDGVTGALTSLREALDGAEAVLALFEQHYRAESTWVEAFAAVLSALFPSLVVLDPRDERLARVARPVHERALRDRDAITRALQRRSDELEGHGFDVQVRVRDAALTFVHPEGRQGPRFRAEGGARLPDDPLCVSTSALLRPIVQDTLLPTVAIVGGPGELNYFAQLAPLYAHFGLPFPMVMPRARFRIVEPRPQSLLEVLGLHAEEVEVPREQLLRRLAPAREGFDVERQLLEAVEPILSRVQGVDDAVHRTRATIARAASRLAGRATRAQLIADEVLTGRVDRLQRALFPHGQPQERVLGAPGFFASFGVRAFLERVDARIVPFGTEVVTA